MQLSSAPNKLTVPFANAGQKNTIPVSSQISNVPGAASYTDGFPPLTMTPVASGGIPPSGLDFNGIFYALSAINVWVNAGAGFLFDAGFASAIGGYPGGARVLRADGNGYWRNLTDNNSTNPDAGGAGWVPEAGFALCSVYASAQQTLASGASKVVYDSVEYDAAGLWDATHHRFAAKWPGKYRISGSTYLASPGGQNLALDIFKNGSLAKRCAEFPQVSDVDVCLPFNVTIPLAVGDYLEVFAQITQAAVLAGVGSGNNSPFVFAQVEYLGA